MALVVPWPGPVAPSDPNSLTLTLLVSDSLPFASTASAKSNAALIGPTVCELEGPIPMVNKSSAEM